MIDCKVQIYKRRRVWYASWKNPKTDKPVWKSLKTGSKSVASMMASKIQVDLVETGFFESRRPTQVTLRKYEPVYIADARVNKKSYKDDVRFMSRFVREWGDKTLGEISPALLEEYKTKRLMETVKGNPNKKPISKSTVDRELAVLRRALNLAVERGELQKCPSFRLFLEENTRSIYLDDKQAGHLLKACENPRAPLLHALVKLALNTGMRRGELLHLKWDDIDFNNGIIQVQQGKTKSSKRAVPLTPGGREALTSVMGVNRLLNAPETPWVFATPEGRRYISPRMAFINARKRAGFGWLHFHDLRHAYARQFLISGGTLEQLHYILGHKTWEMTLRYVAFSHADTIQTARRMGDMWGKKADESPAQSKADNPQP